MAIHYQCEAIALEELTMGSRDAGKGRNFNRLCNNEWNREQFQWLIKKLCDKYNIKCIPVNCAYSSTIGNILHRNMPDPCAAACEISRRAKYKYVKKLCIYPEVNFSEIPILNQWKKEGLNDLTDCDSWKDLHDKLKNSAIKYRVPLDCFTQFLVSDFSSTKSGIVIYSNFII